MGWDESDQVKIYENLKNRVNLILKVSVFLFEPKVSMFAVTNSEQKNWLKKVKINCEQKGDNAITLDGRQCHNVGWDMKRSYVT